ncbi:unnamed protein product [Soboliphyme baturini]|uniref:Retrotransposon protein n=1 Tax=Soboliphyme baturini TaxID=241478 RepID=A0A183IF46_9BILA|nr:unnamed protein product [Soboliphyme baturini]
MSIGSSRKEVLSRVVHAYDGPQLYDHKYCGVKQLILTCGGRSPRMNYAPGFGTFAESAEYTQIPNLDAKIITSVEEKRKQNRGMNDVLYNCVCGTGRR